MGKKRPPEDPVTDVDKRISTLTKFIARENVPYELAEKLDRRRQKLHAARKILTKEKK